MYVLKSTSRFFFWQRMVATERLLVWEEGGETLSGKIPVEDAYSFTLSLHAPNQIPRLHFDSDEAMDGAMEKV